MTEINEKVNYKEMNIFEKLQLARVMLGEEEIKKSGNNSHLKFQYLELSDFLPQLRKIFSKVRLYEKFDFGNSEYSKLIITNIDNPQEQEIFTSPMAEPEQRGSKMQGIGANQTYQRRYMYMNALSIAVPDTLDAELKENKSQTKRYIPPKQNEYITREDKAKLYKIADQNNEIFENALRKLGYEMKSEYIKMSDVPNIIKEIEKLKTDKQDIIEETNKQIEMARQDLEDINFSLNTEEMIAVM